MTHVHVLKTGKAVCARAERCIGNHNYFCRDPGLEDNALHVCCNPSKVGVGCIPMRRAQKQGNKAKTAWRPGLGRTLRDC